MTFLSSKGFCNLSGCQIEEDFTFKTETKEYKCNRVVAIFMSPAVANAIKSDITMDTFELIDPTNSFGLIYDMMQGKPLKADSINYEAIFHLANQLKNDELAELMLSYAEIEPSIYNAIKCIKIKIQLNANYEKELNFVIDNIEKFDIKELAQFGTRFTEKIISKLKNDEAQFKKIIFPLILESIKVNRSDAFLLHPYVKLEYLSKEQISDFIQTMDPRFISPDIWKALILHLSVEQQKLPSSEKDSSKSHNDIPAFQSPFKGILSSMKSQYGADLFAKKYLEIFTTTGDSENIETLLEPDSKTYFITSFCKPTENSPAIVFHFFKNRVSISSYSIKSSVHKKGVNHLKSWVIEGSSNGIDWEILDTKQSVDSLDSPNQIMTYRCDDTSCYWYLRLRLTNVNVSGKYQICLSAIEFHGSEIF